MNALLIRRFRRFMVCWLAAWIALVTADTFAQPRPARLPPTVATGVSPAANPDPGPATLPATEAIYTDGEPAAGSYFPARPPHPYEQELQRLEPLPPLAEELQYRGGSYLYQAEGDRLDWHGPWPAPSRELRLPEDFVEPRPLTGHVPFLGSDMLPPDGWKMSGPVGDYFLDPRFVAFGSYSLFGFDLATNHKRQTALGHQLFVDLDLQLTGTERFHCQFRPVGQRGTGGSYYQFTDPAGYVDHSTVVPDRYWFEGELHSILAGRLDPYFTDVHFTVGKVPFQLHNNLLMNDDVVGVAVNKNTVYCGDLSNLNVIGFFAFDDVDAYPVGDARLAGMHAILEYRLALIEITAAHVSAASLARRDRWYAGMSLTKFFGTWTLTGRAFGEFGDESGTGQGGLFVIESNHTHEFVSDPCGIDYAVFFVNAFHVTDGWNSIATGNFNRLRTAFETNPLIRIAAKPSNPANTGVACGVQLFRHNEDASWIPEVALETPDGYAVFGCGLRYLRKTGPRSFFETLGVLNFSSHDAFDRRGVFVTESIIF